MAAVNPTITVYNPNSVHHVATFPIEPNKKASDSLAKRAVDTTKDAGMQYRYCVALGDTSDAAVRVMSAVGLGDSPAVVEFGKTVKASTHVSALFRLIQLTRDLYEAGGDWALGATVRVHAKAVDTIAEFGAMVCYSAAFVTKNMAFLSPAAVPSLVHEAAGSYLAVSDYLDYSNQIETIKADDLAHGTNIYSGRVKKCLDDTKFHAIVSAVKPILGMIASIATLLALGCASFALSAEVALGMALVASYSAIAAHFLKEGAPETLLSYNKLPVIVV